MEIEIIEPAGFCNGVNRAIKLVDDFYNENKENKQLIMLGNLIHNDEINDYFLKKNVFIVDTNYENLVDFVEDLHSDKCVYILSAHGHFLDLDEKLDKYKLNYIDTTCPIIKTIHNKIIDNIDSNSYVIYIGNKDHIEAETSIKFIENITKNYEIKKTISIKDIVSHENLVIINQSTYYIDEMIEDIPEEIMDEYKPKIIDNYCPTLKLRLNNIKNRINEFDALIVLGYESSSNAKSLYKYCYRLKKSFFVSQINDLNFIMNELTSCKKKIGIVTSTSMSLNFANEVKKYLVDNS